MAFDELRLELIERGEPWVVSAGDWARMSLDEPMERLRVARIIGVRRSQGYFVVEPRHFVGSYESPTLSVVVLPKVPAVYDFLTTLAAVLPRSLDMDGDVEPADEKHLVSSALAFLARLDAVIDMGLPSSYAGSSVATSRPRGKILMTETVRRFASRGASHLVVASHATRAFDADLLLVAVTACSIVAKNATLSDSRRVHSANLGRALSDSRVIDTTTPAIEVLEVAERSRTESTRSDVIALIDAAAAVIAADRNVWDYEDSVANGHAKFANIERLWELAVAWACNSIPNVRAEVHPLAGSSDRLFDDGGPNIDPDVIAYAGSSPSSVLDAKASQRQSAEAGDVYQLLSYCRRLDARIGVLVYFSQGRAWRSHVGTDSTLAIRAIGVDPDHVRASLLAGVAWALAPAQSAKAS